MVTYKTKGVCSTEIQIEVEGEVIKSVKFVRGCPGNLYGISELVKGMEIDEAIKRLDGITCGTKETSCPDQLAKALKEIKEKHLS
ncbi:MAG: TIGR03905 family TSCPD domain-containing protein [Clostridium chrysemydis]|uniref:TIGR03905 family TSCPD domain-containing protein n=1 Tax=Clostridium TaxID=1485 RepID=UPI001883B790|nr:TIGR03905 family TSCPD domain-containing protein [Clostridium sp. LY3-2]MCR6513292.1 TIGR03905 family TSCPD domain-containing protein [Clostridium sp. LY3-2]